MGVRQEGHVKFLHSSWLVWHMQVQMLAQSVGAMAFPLLIWSRNALVPSDVTWNIKIVGLPKFGFWLKCCRPAWNICGWRKVGPALLDNLYKTSESTTRPHSENLNNTLHTRVNLFTESNHMAAWKCTSLQAGLQESWFCWNWQSLCSHIDV